MRAPILVAAVAVTGGIACADVGPFTETFGTGDANWLDGSFNPVAYDAGGFISNSVDITSGGPFGLTLFRAHDAFDASGDAFVGDYLTSGITTVSFDIRHDYTEPLGFALRVATPANSPAFAIELADAVAAGDWTTVSFDLDPNNPLYTPEGPPGFGFFAGVMTQVGNIQVSLSPPDGLPSGTLVTFDLDNVSITPAPGTLALLGALGLVGARRRR